MVAQRSTSDNGVNLNATRAGNLHLVDMHTLLLTVKKRLPIAMTCSAFLAAGLLLVGGMGQAGRYNTDPLKPATHHIKIPPAEYFIRSYRIPLQPIIGPEIDHVAVRKPLRHRSLFV